jgi:hypothetical protein
MRKIQCTLACLGLLFILTGICNTGMAQSRKEKKAVKKKAEEMQAALRNRLYAEQQYANSSRAQFNFTSWVGRPVKELIESWGPATRSVSDGGNGLIYTYEQVNVRSGGSYTPGYVVTQNYYGAWVEVERQNAVDTRYNTTTYSYHDIYVDAQQIIIKIKRR